MEDIILRPCEAKLIHRVLDAVLHYSDFNECATLAEISMLVRVNNNIIKKLNDGE
jgi:hypothetical protein